MATLTHSLNVFSNGELSQPRNFDLVWLIPEWNLVHTFRGQIPSWLRNDPFRFSAQADGNNKYFHLSRVEWNEVQEGRRIYKPNTDHQLVESLPPTVQFIDSGNVPITTNRDKTKPQPDKPCGEIWFEVFRSALPSGTTLLQAWDKWLGLTGDGIVFTDHTGGFECKNVLTTPNVMYLMGETSNHYIVKVLRVGNVQFMREQIEEFPYLKMKATNSLRTYDGRGCNPMHWGLGRDCLFLPFGLNTSTGRVPKNRCQVLSRSEPIPNSYWPPR